jgi:hypothetical protein
VVEAITGPKARLGFPILCANLPRHFPRMLSSHATNLRACRGKLGPVNAGLFSVAVVQIMPAERAVGRASCDYRGPPSRTKCARSISGERFSNDSASRQIATILLPNPLKQPRFWSGRVAAYDPKRTLDGFHLGTSGLPAAAKVCFWDRRPGFYKSALRSPWIFYTLERRLQVSGHMMSCQPSIHGLTAGAVTG